MPECRLSSIRSVQHRKKLKKTDAATSPVTECSVTGLSWWMPECRCTPMIECEGSDVWKLEYKRSGGLMGSWYTCEGGEDWVSLAPRRTRGKERLLGTVLQGEKNLFWILYMYLELHFSEYKNSSLLRIGPIGETDPCDTQTQRCVMLNTFNDDWLG